MGIGLRDHTDKCHSLDKTESKYHFHNNYMAHSVESRGIQICIDHNFYRQNDSNTYIVKSMGRIDCLMSQKNYIGKVCTLCKFQTRKFQMGIANNWCPFYWMDIHIYL